MLSLQPHLQLLDLQYPVDEVTPGELVRLVVTIIPDPDTHVYAPGAEKDHYIVASLTLDPSSLYSVRPTAYPKPEMMHFPGSFLTDLLDLTQERSSKISCCFPKGTVPSFL